MSEDVRYDKKAHISFFLFRPVRYEKKSLPETFEAKTPERRIRKSLTMSGMGYDEAKTPERRMGKSLTMSGMGYELLRLQETIEDLKDQVAQFEVEREYSEKKTFAFQKEAEQLRVELAEEVRLKEMEVRKRKLLRDEIEGEIQDTFVELEDQVSVLEELKMEHQAKANQCRLQIQQLQEDNEEETKTHRNQLNETSKKLEDALQELEIRLDDEAEERAKEAEAAKAAKKKVAELEEQLSTETNSRIKTEKENAKLRDEIDKFLRGIECLKSEKVTVENARNASRAESDQLREQLENEISLKWKAVRDCRRLEAEVKEEKDKVEELEEQIDLLEEWKMKNQAKMDECSIQIQQLMDEKIKNEEETKTYRDQLTETRKMLDDTIHQKDKIETSYKNAIGGAEELQIRMDAEAKERARAAKAAKAAKKKAAELEQQLFTETNSRIENEEEVSKLRNDIDKLVREIESLKSEKVTLKNTSRAESDQLREQLEDEIRLKKKAARDRKRLEAEVEEEKDKVEELEEQMDLLQEWKRKNQAKMDECSIQIQQLKDEKIKDKEEIESFKSEKVALENARAESDQLREQLENEMHLKETTAGDRKRLEAEIKKEKDMVEELEEQMDLHEEWKRKNQAKVDQCSIQIQQLIDEKIKNEEEIKTYRNQLTETRKMLDDVIHQKNEIETSYKNAIGGAEELQIRMDAEAKERARAAKKAKAAKKKLEQQFWCEETVVYHTEHEIKLRNDIDKLLKDMESLKSQKVTLENAKKNLDNACNSLREQVEDLTTKKNRADRARRVAQTEVADLRDIVEELEDEKQDNEFKLSQKTSELAAANQRAEREAKNAARLEALCADNESKLNEAKSQVRKLEHDVAAVRSQIEDLTALKNRSDRARHVAEDKVANLRDQIEELEDKNEDSMVELYKKITAVKKAEREAENLILEALCGGNEAKPNKAKAQVEELERDLANITDENRGGIAFETIEAANAGSKFEKAAKKAAKETMKMQISELERTSRNMKYILFTFLLIFFFIIKFF